MTRAGAMRRRLKVERQSTTQDAVGQHVDTWTELAERRGAVEDVSGREYFAAHGQDSEATTRITIRYDSTLRTVTPADRIRDDAYSPAVVYDIKAVLHDGLNRQVQFMCTRNG